MKAVVIPSSVPIANLELNENMELALHPLLPHLALSTLRVLGVSLSATFKWVRLFYIFAILWA